MSAQTAAPGLDVASTPRIPFGRLLAVELRKMRNTRAGFWLLLSTGLLLVAVAGIALLVILLNDFDASFQLWATQIMVPPLSLLLPVFAITSVTSEWSQRTGLVTFALEPHRLRVLGAKLVCVVLLAVVTIALAAVVAVVAVLLQGALSGNDVDWSIEGGPVTWTFMLQLLYFLMAFAAGVLLLNTAAAVALYYVFALLVPVLVWGPIYGLFSWSRDVIPWIDMGYASQPLTAPGSMPRPDEIYLQVATSTSFWVIVPLASASGVRCVPSWK